MRPPIHYSLHPANRDEAAEVHRAARVLRERENTLVALDSAKSGSDDCVYAASAYLDARRNLEEAAEQADRARAKR